MKTKIFNAVCKTRYLALLVVLIFTCGNVWGTDYTYDFSTVTNKWYTNSTHTTTASTGSENNYTTVYYTDGTTWTASGTSHYFSTGYYLLGKKDAVLNLPTYSGEKITQVKLHGSNGHSTSVSVNIYTTDGTAASTSQTWSTKGQDHTYAINSSYQSSALRVQVTNAYNTQFTQIVITTEASDCNTVDVTGGSAVILPAGSTSYTGGDWGDAGAPTAYPSSTTEYMIGTGLYCVTLTKAADYSKNSNGLQFQADNGVLLLEDITSNYGIDVEILIGSGSGFSIALDGATTLTGQDAGTKTISTTYTSANLTISKPTSGAGYIKYIKVTPKAASCANSVTIIKGTETNCTISASAASVSTCSGTRQVTISVTPNTCYAAPVKASVTSTGTTATWVSGPTLNSGHYDYVYSFAENATGETTFNASLSTKTTYTVNYDKGTYGTGSNSSDTKTCGVNLALPSSAMFTRDHYTQTGWSTAAAGNTKTYNLGASYTTDAGTTLYPYWEAEKYTVTWSVNGSTYTTTANVSYNTTTSTPANPNVPDECTGSTFRGWTATQNYTGDSAPGDLFNGTSPTITRNITFYAVFADYAD